MTESVELLETKVCTKCGEPKSIEEFYTYPNGTTLGQCRACKSEMRKLSYLADRVNHIARAKKWNDEHKDRVRENGRLNREARKEELIEYRKQYRANNLEFVKELQRKWCEQHPDRKKKAEMAWYLNNKDKVFAKVRNRKAKLRLAVATHTGKDVITILAYQDCKCKYCGATVTDTYHVDHIFPISKIRYNGPANLQILCKECNLKKGAKSPLEHERSIGILTEDREKFLLQLLQFISLEIEKFKNI